MKYKAETFIIAGFMLTAGLLYNRAVENHYSAEASTFKGQVISYEKHIPDVVEDDRDWLTQLSEARNESN